MAVSSLELMRVNVISKAIESGAFGENVEFIGVVQDSTEGRDHFLSKVIFLNVELSVDGVVQTFPVVCKFQHDCVEVRNARRTDLQFYNEIIAYKHIVPMLPSTVGDLMPRFYFGEATLNETPCDDVIIVQNLTPLGYRHTDENIFLDFQHCCLAFRKLGEFHGGSIQVKSTQPMRFTRNMNELRETRWFDACGTREKQNYFYRENAKRGVVPLLKVGEHEDVLARFLERLNDVYGIVERILKVNELSVICHGDFCRNNMIFRYDQGRPVDVKFFDLANVVYTSPVIDISYVLFLNTSVELRRRHFKQDFIREYLKGVESIAGPGALSIDKLWEEFQEKALYGYLLTAPFLPILLNDLPDTPAQRLNMTLEDRVSRNLIRGGLKVTEILTEVVRDLVSWGCV